jgi:hypothetical protein
MLVETRLEEEVPCTPTSFSDFAGLQVRAFLTTGWQAYFSQCNFHLCLRSCAEPT